MNALGGQTPTGHLRLREAEIIVISAVVRARSLLTHCTPEFVNVVIPERIQGFRDMGIQECPCYPNDN
eukprot:733514-Amorphochlora_amoeboformis.AAC.1